MPSITQLEYILAVEKHRHFGKAARECHVSQPTLSQQIQKLEDELDVVVFDRIHKPIIPTPEGQRVIELAKSVVREHQKLVHFSKSVSSGVSGAFKLGIIPTVATHLLPLFLDSFSKAYPKVELFIEELKTETLIKELRDDRLDGAIMATPISESDFNVMPLYYETFSLYLSAGHPLQKKSTIQANDLDGTQMWLLKEGHCFKDQVVNFCSIKNPTDSVLKNVHFQSGSLDILRSLIRKGTGYTLIPQLMVSSLSAAEIKSHVRSFKVPAPAREISLVYRRDYWKLDVMKAIEKSIHQSVKSKVSLQKTPQIRVLGVC